MTKITAIPNGSAQEDVLDLTVGEPAHGGWCVARTAAAGPDQGKVVFVRHALPGERVRARVTSSTAKFARADAVEVLEPSPDRVEPPCRYARPGGCGGCDLQHASPAAQREIKAQVISQQLRRMAGIEREVVVEALPGDPAGLGWRTRVSFAVGREGTAGLRKHRSREVIGITDCLIAHPLVRTPEVTGRPWPAAQGVDVTVSPGSGERSVTVTGRGGRARQQDRPSLTAPAAGRSGRGRPVGQARRGQPGGESSRDQPGGESGAGRPDSERARPWLTQHAVGGSGRGRSAGESGAGRPDGERARPWLTQHATGRTWRVSSGVFWQVHPAAADVLTEVVLDALRPEPGDAVLDLYCGAGLFTAALAEAVGPAGLVSGVESDVAAVRDARKNLSGYPQVRVHRGDAAQVLEQRGLGGATLAVLDPPRTGADRRVIELLAAGGEPAGAEPGPGGHAAGEAGGAVEACDDTEAGQRAEGGPVPGRDGGEDAVGQAVGRLQRIAYVSCDPATLARDIAVFAGLGWRLEDLRAFDAFPMTHHVECVATLVPHDRGPGPTT